MRMSSTVPVNLTCLHIYVHLCIYMHACTHTKMHTAITDTFGADRQRMALYHRIYIYTYIYIRIHNCVRVYMYIHIPTLSMKYVHARAHTHKYIYISYHIHETCWYCMRLHVAYSPEKLLVHKYCRHASHSYQSSEGLSEYVGMHVCMYGSHSMAAMCECRELNSEQTTHVCL
jgi:hypothetical protein